MQDRWLDKRIDLKLLSEQMIQFFEEKDFVTKLEESPKEFKVLAVPRHASHVPAYQISENINVFIRGEPDDFSIEFVSGSRSRLYIRLGGFLSFFGAGGLMMQGLKSLEELQRLEDDFWKFTDKAVDILSSR